MRTTFFLLALPWLFGAMTTGSGPALFAGSAMLTTAWAWGADEEDDDDQE